MMLQAERQKTTFDVEEMAHLLYGSKDRYQKFINCQKLVDEDPVLKSDVNFYNLSRKEQLLVAARVFTKYPYIIDPSIQDNFLECTLLPKTLIFTSVNQAMVVPAFQVLGSEEQKREWLPKLHNFTAIGCYAQTELGHGSDVQNLGTTATFDSDKNEFIIDTPTLDSTKFWPGDLGLLANYALVYAQVVINGKSQGVYPIWVPIRDQNHQPFPGVTVGDIGPKLGYSTKDNGYLAFKNYRVKAENMLSKFSQIKNGQVVKTGNSKIAYASMMAVRKVLTQTFPRFAGKSLTIAVRYSLQRKQFKDDNQEEIVVMDYQLQQDKLIPLIAELYMSIFGGLRIKHIVEDNFRRVETSNDFSQMGLTHAILCGTKATYTQYVIHAAEWCRLSCGGHGYAHYSGLPGIYFETAPNVTLEGENTVLYLQLARFLLKQLRNVAKTPNSISPYFQFLLQQPDTSLLKDNITTVDQLLLLHGWNVSSLLNYAALKLTSQKGISVREAWDTKAGISLVNASTSYVPYFNLLVMKESIQQINKPQICKVLTQLGSLYGINSLLTNMHGLHLRNLIGQDQIAKLKQTKYELLEALRPNVLGLVESQGLSDNTLRSLIGTHDGDPYAKLYNYAANENTVNNKDKHIQKGLEYIKQMRNVTPKL